MRFLQSGRECLRNTNIVIDTRQLLLRCTTVHFCQTHVSSESERWLRGVKSVQKSIEFHLQKKYSVKKKKTGKRIVNKWIRTCKIYMRRLEPERIKCRKHIYICCACSVRVA